MQIREMSFKELYPIHELLKQLHLELTYDAFEDLIYDMRHIEYKMFGLLERGELISFAGVAVQTNFSYKRHLYVYDFVTDKPFRSLGYGATMLEFLNDYAKTCMCENIVFASDSLGVEEGSFCQKHSFTNERALLLKRVI